MSPASRYVPALAAIGIGVATGVYIWQPLLKEYEKETHGTWVPPEQGTTTNAPSDKPNSASPHQEKQEPPTSITGDPRQHNIRDKTVEHIPHLDSRAGMPESVKKSQ